MRVSSLHDTDLLFFRCTDPCTSPSSHASTLAVWGITKKCLSDEKGRRQCFDHWPHCEGWKASISPIRYIFRRFVCGFLTNYLRGTRESSTARADSMVCIAKLEATRKVLEFWKSETYVRKCRRGVGDSKLGNNRSFYSLWKRRQLIGLVSSVGESHQTILPFFCPS